MLFSWPVPLLVDGGACTGRFPWSSRLMVAMPGWHVTSGMPHMSGNPNCWLYTFRSASAWSYPKESTIAIVRPRPSRPFEMSGVTL